MDNPELEQHIEQDLIDAVDIALSSYSVTVADAAATLATERGALEAMESRIAQARELLGVDEGASALMVMHVYKPKAKQSPELEPGLTEAYAVITEGLTRAAGVAAAEQQLRRARQLERLVSRLGWPSEWPPALLPVWVFEGGTGDSARAWARQGWEAETVLTSPRLGPVWNGPIGERVRKLDPPAVPDPDDLLDEQGYFERHGLTPSEAEMFVSSGISRGDTGDDPKKWVDFVEAADYHGVEDIPALMADGEGDPQRAWEIWGELEDQGISR